MDPVVDVRSIPRFRANPQFNEQGLPEALAPWQMGYEHIAELGGLRRKDGKHRSLAKRLLAVGELSAIMQTMH